MTALHADVDRSEIHTQDHCDGPQILKADVEDAIRHMQKGKAPEPDNIIIEEKMLLVLGVQK